MKAFYSHISAVAQNNTIGFKGKLPWHIPEDLKFFYQKTKGHALIMGRKTFESLGEPLPHRLHVVVTRQKNFQAKALSVVLCRSIEDAMAFCSQKEVLKKHGSEVFITGGGEIYKQSLSFVKYIYLTRIHKSYKGDAFYPELPQGMFKEISRKDFSGDPSYSFITYEKANIK